MPLPNASLPPPTSLPSPPLQAYIMPNKKIEGKQLLSHYHCDLSVVERHSGLEFFRAWDQKQLEQIDVDAQYKNVMV